ncbi:MAG: phenylalanine--tRNA ligase subunit alpha [Candidatus Diapherotrites archaeon]|nr:phenylalanine--tRNA ligase subunit alpha [Candidatus Diapherotrites archaeon]
MAGKTGDLGRIRELSDIERKAILGIGDSEKSFEEIASEAALSIDSVRRACAWLAEKGFAKISETRSEKLFLTAAGKTALEKGMPENIFLEVLTKLGGKAGFKDLMEESKLDVQEFNAALGINKKKAFITIVNGVIEETGVAKSQETFEEQNLLESISEGKKVEALELFKRGLVEKKEFIERKISITNSGKAAREILSTQKVSREFDVEAPVPELFLGKKAPYVQFLNQIRQKLVALGFKEMNAPLIVPEFYNFDVLFQPQNHPARAWTDTYHLKQPRFGVLPSAEKVKAVKAAHENGGVSASTGWRYNWNEEIAKRLMPAAHGTAHSARQLVEGVEMPRKYFAIARCFRPDVLDATHLIEFNQLEGFIVGDDLNFGHLLGMLEEFAVEIAGAKKVKFIPDYYPFTEPSVQLSAKHPEMGWVEFAGAGMFRPEMLKNLGIKGEAIAWGIGIDRLAMFKLGTRDIRDLFSENLGYLRKAKAVML